MKLMEKVVKRKPLELRTPMTSTHTPGSASFSGLLIKICCSPEIFNLVLIVQTTAEKSFLALNIKD